MPRLIESALSVSEKTSVLNGLKIAADFIRSQNNGLPATGEEFANQLDNLIVDFLTEEMGDEVYAKSIQSITEHPAGITWRP